MRICILLALCSAAWAQSPPIPVDQEPSHHLVLSNNRVRVFDVELAPHQQSLMHRHDRDNLAVRLVDGRVTSTRVGQSPVEQRFHRGDYQMTRGGYAHTVRNDADTIFRVTDVEFAEPQGAVQPQRQKPSRYCNPGSKTACVNETYLFCSDKICASEVTIGPGAITTRHTHATDHMLVAISDYQFSDDVEGKGKITRKVASGGVEYFPAGLTHQLTNVAATPARFIVIVFR